MPEGFIFGDGEMPPGLKRLAEQAEMRHELAQLEVDRFFEELDIEAMKTCASIIHAVATEPTIGFYWIGMLTERLNIRIKAEEELIPPEPELPDDLKAQLGLYNVELISDRVPNGPLTCKGCGTIYPNLADRMIKKPGDCDGCIHKAKFG